MKILIIRLSSMGDVVLTTPVVRCLHEQLDHPHLHFLTKAAFVPLMSGWGYLEKVIDYSDDPNLGALLLHEGYDLVVDLQHNRTSHGLRRWTPSARWVSYDKEDLARSLYVLTHHDFLKHKHVAMRYLAAVRCLGVEYDHRGLELHCRPPQPPISLPWGDSPYLLIACGAQHVTKQIPEHRLAWLLGRLEVPVVLVGDQKDGQRLRDSLQVLTGSQLNLCGQTSILQLVDLVQRAALVLTPDTGVMHIATALKKKMMVVWGSTVPEFGFGPLDVEFQNFETKGLRCRPCSKLGKRRCPKGDMQCMNLLDWELIAAALNQV